MGENETHIDIYDLIVKKLDGTLSDAESVQFNTAMQNPDHKKMYEDTQRIWNVSDEQSQIIFDTDAAYEKVEARFAKPKSHSLSVWYSAAAVAIVIAVSAYFISTLKTPGEIQSPQIVQHTVKEFKIEAKETTLKDNSVVKLNKNTTLTYADNFGDSTREVHLEGEAYFSVARDTSTPFVIHTELIDVKVLGTSFYVKAQKGNPVYDVIVTSGTVWVSSKDNAQNGVVLQAGDNIRYNSQTKEFLPFKVDENDLSWNTKKIKFRRTKLTEVKLRLENLYNVKINLDDDVKDLQLSAKFNETHTIDQIIAVIKATLDVEITKEDNKITIHAK